MQNKPNKQKTKKYIYWVSRLFCTPHLEHVYHQPVTILFISRNYTNSKTGLNIQNCIYLYMLYLLFNNQNLPCRALFLTSWLMLYFLIRGCIPCLPVRTKLIGFTEICENKKKKKIITQNVYNVIILFCQFYNSKAQSDISNFLRLYSSKWEKIKPRSCRTVFSKNRTKMTNRTQ